MENDDQSVPDFSGPYSFKQLYERYRQLLGVIGGWPKDQLTGKDLWRFTHEHDDLRHLVSWNFLALAHELPAYEPVITVGDWEATYRITDQAREFSNLELNNISDLTKAILILLRADFSPEVLQGFARVSIRTLGFYELVMLLNKSEEAILGALRRLESLGLIKATLVFLENGRVWNFASKLEITQSGIVYLEKGELKVTFNNINIHHSSVGVVSLQSTLSNIDVRIGLIKSQGHSDVANALAQITEEVTESELLEPQKRDILEQVDLLTEQAQKEPGERKLGIVKAVLVFMDKALGSVANLATIWTALGSTITGYFGI